MKKHILTACLMLLLASPCLGAGEPRPVTTPDKLVRNAIDEIGLLLGTPRGVAANDPRQLYAMMDFSEDVMPHIDFHAMARYALGRYWRVATDAQRAQFTRQFRNQLVRIYGTALYKNANARVVYLPFSGRPEDDTATVKTEVRPAGGGPNVSINYSFYQVHSVWKMYDITIDGMSLVTTYHDVYAETLRKEGIDVLIADMAKRNNAPYRGKPGSTEPAHMTEKSAAP